MLPLMESWKRPNGLGSRSRPPRHPADRASPVDDGPVLRLAAYGHSYVEGAAASAASRRFVDIASCELGCTPDNNGVGGSVSTDTALMVAAKPPSPADLYILMTGLNDARLYGEDTTGLTAYASALTVIFDAFEAANPRSQVIAVEQPHLRVYSRHHPYDKGSDALIDAYNQRLREAAARCPSVVLARVDSWGKSAMIAADTVHPNDLGHREIARAVYCAAVVTSLS